MIDKEIARIKTDLYTKISRKIDSMKITKVNELIELNVDLLQLSVQERNNLIFLLGKEFNTKFNYLCNNKKLKEIDKFIITKEKGRYFNYDFENLSTVEPDLKALDNKGFYQVFKHKKTLNLFQNDRDKKYLSLVEELLSSKNDVILLQNNHYRALKVYER